MFEDITNYVQMADNIATSGQPQNAQFADISAAGYEAVINLAMPDSDAAIPNEGSVVALYGMTYVHIPVPFNAPAEHHLKQFMGIMTALEPSKIWVHCVVNYRVSAFMFHYLTRQRGMSEAESSSPILQQWRPKMDPVWQDFMQLQTRV